MIVITSHYKNVRLYERSVIFYWKWFISPLKFLRVKLWTTIVWSIVHGFEDRIEFGRPYIWEIP